jgi:hypothetical protein
MLNVCYSKTTKADMDSLEQSESRSMINSFIFEATKMNNMNLPGVVLKKRV